MFGVYRLGYAQGAQDARLGINGGRSIIHPLPFFGGIPYYGFGPRIRIPFLFTLFVPFFWIGVFLLVFFIIRALIQPWGSKRPAAMGPTGNSMAPGAPGPMPGEAGPYDPYHLRDKQSPAGDQPGSAGGTGSSQ
jgi:hypothetical protein